MAIFKQKTPKGIMYGVRIWHNGRDIRKVIGKDRKTAEVVEAALRKEIADAKASGQSWTGLEQVHRAKKAKTFAEAAQEYMDERKHFKQSTLVSYRSTLDNYLLPEFGKSSLRLISESQVAKFQARICQTISARRTNAIMQLLRSILDTATRRGDVNASAAKNVMRVREPKTKVDPLSEQELQLVLSKIDAHYRPLFITLAYTGARPNELLALRWSDIDWNKKEIEISKGLVRGYEGLPKTASSERLLPMVPMVEAALVSLKQRPTVAMTDHIFTDKKGLPIRKHLDRIWSAGLKRAGVRHRPSYQLRHTFASQCLMKGLSPGYVAKLLGHSTLETLYRHYARWISDASRDQEHLLRGFFAGTESKSDLAENLAVARTVRSS